MVSALPSTAVITSTVVVLPTMCALAYGNPKRRFQLSVLKNKDTGEFIQVFAVRALTGHHFWLDDYRLSVKLEGDRIGEVVGKYTSALSHKTRVQNLMGIARAGLVPGGMVEAGSFSGRCTTNLGLFLEGDPRNVVAGRMREGYDVSLILDAQRVFGDFECWITPNGIITTRDVIPFAYVQTIILHKPHARFPGCPNANNAMVLYSLEYEDTCIVGQTGGLELGGGSTGSSTSSALGSLPQVIAEGRANSITQIWDGYVGKLITCPKCGYPFPSGYTTCLNCQNFFKFGIRMPSQSAGVNAAPAVTADSDPSRQEPGQQEEELLTKDEARSVKYSGKVWIRSIQGHVWDHVMNGYKWRRDWHKKDQEWKTGMGRNGTTTLVRGADMAHSTPPTSMAMSRSGTPRV